MNWWKYGKPMREDGLKSVRSKKQNDKLFLFRICSLLTQQILANSLSTSIPAAAWASGWFRVIFCLNWSGAFGFGWWKCFHMSTSETYEQGTLRGPRVHLKVCSGGFTAHLPHQLQVCRQMRVDITLFPHFPTLIRYILGLLLFKMSESFRGSLLLLFGV